MKDKKIRTVVIESPYAGDIEKNMRYVRACMRDCLLRGEAPFASHALYTQEGVLKDEVPEERMHGITAGFAWRETSGATVVYLDLGISKGMEYGIAHAKELGHPIEERYLGDNWDSVNTSSLENKKKCDHNWVMEGHNAGDPICSKCFKRE